MNDTVTNPKNVSTSAKHGEDITAIASPRPWRIPEVGLIPTEIWSADGTPVAHGVSSPNAVLIVEAVNAIEAVHALSIKLYDPLRKAEEERDRLREIVDAMNNEPMLDILKADLADANKDVDLLRGERDRLRDIVRRMIPLVEVAEKYAWAESVAIKGLCSLKGVDSRMVDPVQADIAALVREARAAIKDEVSNDHNA